jgi:hypothetical protein
MMPDHITLNKRNKKTKLKKQDAKAKFHRKGAMMTYFLSSFIFFPFHDIERMIIKIK